MTSDEQKAVELVKDYARAMDAWKNAPNRDVAADCIDTICVVERNLHELGSKLLEAALK